MIAGPPIEFWLAPLPQSTFGPRLHSSSAAITTFSIGHFSCLKTTFASGTQHNRKPRPPLTAGIPIVPVIPADMANLVRIIPIRLSMTEIGFVRNPSVGPVAASVLQPPSEGKREVN